MSRNRAPWLRRVAGAVALALPCAAGAQEGAAPGAPKELTPAEQKAADMRMPRLDRSALTPESREPVKVEETDLNPFGMVTMVMDQLVTAEPITEEKRLRQFLSNLRVSGYSESNGRRRVLLGQLAVGEGDRLPPLFAGQAEQLFVSSITDRGIVLKFVESDTSKQERTIGLPIDLRPRVDSLLAGEFFLKVVPMDGDGNIALPALEHDAAKGLVESAKETDLQSLIERRTELFNAPAVPETDEEAPQQ